MATGYCTCLHLAVHGGRPVQHQTLDLQELVRLVATDDGEAEPAAALLQLGVDEGSLQLGRVPCEEGLPSCGTTHCYIKHGVGERAVAAAGKKKTWEANRGYMKGNISVPCMEEDYNDPVSWCVQTSQRGAMSLRSALNQCLKGHSKHLH